MFMLCIRFSVQPLNILGVTGPFSVLAENIYALCDDVFKVYDSLFVLNHGDQLD